MHLDYQRRHRISKRAAWVLLAGGLALVTALAYRYAGQIMTHLELLAAQKSCIEYENAWSEVPVFSRGMKDQYIETKDEIVQSQGYDDEWNSLLRSNPDLKEYIDPIDPAHPRIGKLASPWARLRTLLPITGLSSNLRARRFTPEGTVFLGQLTSPAGHTRLVAVDVSCGIWEAVMSDATGETIFQVVVIQPATLFQAPVLTEIIYGPTGPPGDGVSSLLDPVFVLYPGQVSSDDPSSFVARARVQVEKVRYRDGIYEERKLVGRLRDDGTLDLKVTGARERYDAVQE